MTENYIILTQINHNALALTKLAKFDHGPVFLAGVFSPRIREIYVAQSPLGNKIFSVLWN